MATPAPATSRTSRDTVPVVMQAGALASITTDTGAFEPGHRDFTHYTTPGLCVAAALTMANVLRDPLPALRNYDTLRYHPDKDTLPPQASALARACGAKFTLANTPSAQWGPLFDLALLEHDDSLAEAVLTSRVAITPSVRAPLHLEALALYLGSSIHGLHGAEPARPQLADALLTTIDHEDDLATQLTAHQTMLWYTTMIQDGRRALQEASRLSMLVHQEATSTSNVAVAGSQLQTTYRQLMRLMYFVAPDSMPAVAQLAQEYLRRFSSDAVCRSWIPGCRTASATQIGAQLEGTILRNMSHQALYWPALGVGQRAAPLPVAFWFPPPVNGHSRGAVRDTVISSFVEPVTVLLLPEESCQVDPDALRYFNLCRGVVETVRRWVHRFPPTEVSIVLVAKEFGGAFLSGAETPDAEAERIRWYFQDFQGLPVAIAVQRSTRPPLSDGRYLFVQNDKTLFLAAPWPLSGGIQLVDRHGTLVFEDSFIGNETDFPDVSEILEKMARSVPPTSTSTTFSAHP